MPLASGQPVEVRTRFDGRWVEGFAVSEPAEDGYRVRRGLDGVTLPDVMHADEVRPIG